MVLFYLANTFSKTSQIPLYPWLFLAESYDFEL
ncbi:MAG: hypothetical protein [Podoviridae sp. ctLUJ1]|nr:MAG: hypothetical protein [Podoviridae sp. ctLUJ1]